MVRKDCICGMAGDDLKRSIHLMTGSCSYITRLGFRNFPSKASRLFLYGHESKYVLAARTGGRLSYPIVT